MGGAGQGRRGAVSTYEASCAQSEGIFERDAYLGLPFRLPEVAWFLCSSLFMTPGVDAEGSELT